jgi:hypothetical protein
MLLLQRDSDKVISFRFKRLQIYDIFRYQKTVIPVMIEGIEDRRN